MPIYVEAGELVTARMTLRNASPETLRFKVQAALFDAAGNPVAASPEIPATIAGGGTAPPIDAPLSAPVSSGLYSSYILGVYQKPDGTWWPAMDDYSFMGVEVYAPGLQVVDVTWV